MKKLKWIGVSLLALVAAPALLRAGLESATFVGDLVTSNPTNTDLVSAGDDHIRLIKAALVATFPNASRAFYFPGAQSKTTTYSVVAADQNDLILADATSGAFNVTLPTLASGDAGWSVTVQKTDTSFNVVTVAGTIEGLSNYALSNQWDSGTFTWSGTAWSVVATRGMERVAFKTASTTLTTAEFETTITVSPASNTTLTLPSATNRRGRWYNIKRYCLTSFTVTIDGNAAELIDNDLTVPVWACQSVKVVSDGTNWVITASGGRMGRPAPGTITDYGGGTLPTGALLAYGQAVSRTTYADLFAQIGTTYGIGDGSTTFNMPDTRGRVTAGEDDMGGVSANNMTSPVDGDVLGAAGGAQTLTSAQLPVVSGHTHFGYTTTDCGTQTSLDSSGQVAREGSFSSEKSYNLCRSGVAATVGLSSSNGGFGSGSGHIQPTIVVQKVIWY